MRADELAKMRALEDTHWWFQGRRYLLRNLIRRLRLRDALILDAGCGTGFALTELARAGTVFGLDAAAGAFESRPPRSRMTGCIALIEHAPFQSDTFDLVVAMDLLEHLDDDTLALQEMYRICRPGGYLFVTAPAFRWIWSRHDEALGHRRRYSIAELGQKARDAGFEILRRSYSVTGVFPLAAIYRLVWRQSARAKAGSDLFPVSEPANSLLKALMKLESRLVWHASLPFGLTALLLARKERN